VTGLLGSGIACSSDLGPSRDMSHARPRSDSESQAQHDVSLKKEDLHRWAYRIHFTGHNLPDDPACFNALTAADGQVLGSLIDLEQFEAYRRQVTLKKKPFMKQKVILIILITLLMLQTTEIGTTLIILASAIFF